MQNSDTQWIAKLKLNSGFHDPDQQELLEYALSSQSSVPIGREAPCGILTDSRYAAVSRVHVEIRRIQTATSCQWQLVDRNATNGTYLNGESLQRGECRVMQSGDRIRLSKDGPEFLFEYQVITAGISIAPVISTQDSPIPVASFGDVSAAPNS
ncbi:MAG: FHA domain-containing protein [Kovacikia sp.]